MEQLSLQHLSKQQNEQMSREQNALNQELQENMPKV
jgi:hypothetical protein